MESFRYCRCDFFILKNGFSLPWEGLKHQRHLGTGAEPRCDKGHSVYCHPGELGAVGEQLSCWGFHRRLRVGKAVKFGQNQLENGFPSLPVRALCSGRFSASGLFPARQSLNVTLKIFPLYWVALTGLTPKLYFC